MVYNAAAAKSLKSCPPLFNPHRWQPTRLPCPWDSPGRNTGVGCHFLLQCMKVKSESEVAQSCLTLSDPMAAAYQAPPSMGFSRQEYWSGLPLPSPSELHKGTLLSEDHYNHGVSNWMVRVRQQLLEVLGHQVGKLVAVGRETDKPLCDLCHPWSKDGNTTSWV